MDGHEHRSDQGSRVEQAHTLIGNWLVVEFQGRPCMHMVVTL